MNEENLKEMRETEQEIKEIVRENKGILSDSFELTYGTPSKGSQVSLKCYADFSQLDDTKDNPVQKKVDGLLKIRQYLLDKGIIQ